MHTVKQIVIYPIKGLGGISLQKANAFVEGFEHDRRWMLVDADGNFLSQRNNAKMALFSTRIIDRGIKVSYGNDEAIVPFDQHLNVDKNVTVWDSQLKAQEVDPILSEWFSDHLNLECSLVSMTNVSHRVKTLAEAPFETKVSFADGYPYLIIGEQSLATLNEKLDTPLLKDRFRANIIVSSSIAHEEDEWPIHAIGSATMKVIKPCARCSVVTIDQQAGEVGKEPLKTLASYRKKDNKIFFGANAIALKEGVVSVGDPISFLNN